MFQHTLVAYDGSEESAAGFHFALRLAELSGGRVTMVHVLDSPTETLDSAPEPGPALEDWLQQCQESWTERLGSLAAAAPAGVEVTTRVLRGSPPLVLADLIAEAAPDLAVAGTHGVGLRRYLLGSVSQRLLERAGCDLLLIRDRGWEGRPLSVIVGMDESENARRALQRGGALASHFSARLVLVHVSDHRIPFAMTDAYPSVTRTLREHGRRLLADAHSTVTAPVESVREDLREGSPHVGLIAACHEHEPAIAVVGGHGSHGLLIGSTARELVNEAPCPVLVVRESAGPSD